MKIVRRFLIYFGLIESKEEETNYTPGTDDYADKNVNTWPIDSTAHNELYYDEPSDYMIN